MTDKKFDLIVEGRSPDPSVASRPELELERLVWNGDSPPDVVLMQDSNDTEDRYVRILYKVGRYAAPGDRYSYRVATVARLVEGKLMKVP